jgi:hypothetical protein
LSASDASQASEGGATIAAHSQHLRYGLSLMNRWATAGGNPFADATWDEAWKLSAVTEPQWEEIRRGLRDDSQRWLAVLESPREVNGTELNGLIASIAHLAYHMGAIRQIARAAGGPRNGTFAERRGLWRLTSSNAGKRCFPDWPEIAETAGSSLSLVSSHASSTTTQRLLLSWCRDGSLEEKHHEV